MKVLLLKDIESLGKTGDTKEVAEGYYRNFLVPKQLAVPATPATLKQLAQQREVQARRAARASTENREFAERIRRAQVVFRVKVGEQHRLYGSVTAADVAEELERVLGQPVDKRHVDLEEPIRHLGTFEVPVKLAAGLEPKVTVLVEREDQEAEQPD